VDERIERTRRTYDRVAGRFLENTRDRGGTRGWLERFAARLEPGARVLDVGAGPGFDAAQLRGLGLRALAVDLSMGMLRSGLAEFPGPRAQCDLRELPFAAGVFAGAWANASLLHLSQAEVSDALAEIRRVLRPRGALHVSLKLGRGAGWENARYGEPRWFQYWGADELDRAFANGGFRVCAAATEPTPRDTWLVRLVERAS
jgi:ubiquinone/menaquinone biosynthesis C-methylase UbiE